MIIKSEKLGDVKVQPIKFDTQLMVVLSRDFKVIHGEDYLIRAKERNTPFQVFQLLSITWQNHGTMICSIDTLTIRTRDTSRKYKIKPCSEEPKLNIILDVVNCIADGEKRIAHAAKYNIPFSVTKITEAGTVHLGTMICCT